VAEKHANFCIFRLLGEDLLELPAVASKTDLLAKNAITGHTRKMSSPGIRDVAANSVSDGPLAIAHCGFLRATDSRIVGLSESIAKVGFIKMLSGCSKVSEGGRK
jgi:hypothetical protein